MKVKLSATTGYSLVRAYSTSAHSCGSSVPLQYLRAPNGDVVEFPHGATQPVSANIAYVGVSAVRQLLPDWNPRAKLVNKAASIYLNQYRPFLVNLNAGMWIAVGSDGRVIMGPDQISVATLANRIFQPMHHIDYHIDCIGREVRYSNVGV